MSNNIIDTDSEDEIPPGWEERVTFEGRVFYASHDQQNTQWKHPVTGKEKYVRGELPYGWERVIQDDGTIVYVDHINKKTCFTDPRLAFAEPLKTSPKDFRQKFDGNSSALQILNGRDLTGKYAIITGASDGIGYETAKSLAFHGATIIMACRNTEKAEKCKSNILKDRPKATIEILHLDLASLRSVKQFAEEYKRRAWPLHMLILNAGVFGLPYVVTENDLEMTFQVNHLSHFYLTKLLYDLLVSSAPSRVVVLSSESHRFPKIHMVEDVTEDSLSLPKDKYSDMNAYNISKLCNNLFSLHLNKLLAGKKVTSNSLHPGSCISTNLQRNWWLYRVVFFIVRPFTKSKQQGAATTVYCATHPDVEEIGGMYFNNCCPCQPSKESMDEQLAEKLWTVSETILQDRLARLTSI
ncbi:WW domain-containing oxidoreductase [Mytilus galloprovincialis]|uniref:WW domain-containing oxidoreductase n=1 Tax=Mytilus galloprovincialis TaxID=29158 RepID=A0A8B6H7M5_MYTGA|nr:WW domain-containing oxidoreductase [Mytilus galloprovincialis]